MNRLRRSRFIKFIAGILSVLLCAAIVLNVVGTIILMDENLYYATRQQLQQKVYSYIYEYTASDLMRYLNRIEDMNTIDGGHHNYNDSEIQLYRSKYSQENSNIYFEIRDEYGHLLLNNESRGNEDVFVFSQVFKNHYNAYGYNGGWYVKGDSYREAVSYTSPEDVIVTEQTTVYENGTIEIVHPEYESTTYPEEYYEEEYAENELNATEVLTTLVPRTPAPSGDKNDYNIQEYEITNSYSGNTVELHYYYTDEISQPILDYCKEFLQSLPYNITEFSFRQDEYYVEIYEESEDEYNTEIWPTFGANDAVPATTFTTKLLTDGNETELTYTYRGSLILSEFRDRLKYICLAEKISDDIQSYSYMQKGNSQLIVTVNVPVYSAYVKDIYFYAECLVDAAMNYKSNIVAITLLYAAGLLICLIYIFWSAGYIPHREKPVARGLHAIPFDLYVVLTALACVGCAGMICIYDELFIMLGSFGLVFIALFFIYTLPVRIRAGKLRSNNLITYLYRAIKKSAAVTNEATHSRLAIVLCVLVFVIITIFEIILFIICNETNAATITLLIAIGEIPLIIATLVILTALHNGARAISKGDITYRIDKSFLIGPFRRHAEYLNSINDAVNRAVDERMRSESLKTELITNVSHDLKTPLTSIVNYIDLLKKTDISDRKALEYIEVIDRQSQRLKKLTVDIVEASKAATGNVEVNLEKTALNVMLLQTHGEYSEKLEEKNLTLVDEIPEKEIFITADGRLLWRVIDNLMNNICKYSMPGTRVYLTLWENNGRAFISFRNISKNKLNITPENLTERFVRGDSSRNTEGSGLGLSIAKSLTDIMGGRLSIIIDGDLFKVTLAFPSIDSPAAMAENEAEI